MSLLHRIRRLCEIFINSLRYRINENGTDGRTDNGADGRPENITDKNHAGRQTGRGPN